MRETQIYQYYAFGYNYGALKTYDDTDADRLKGADDDSLQSRITDFLSTIESLRLPVTLKASAKLRALLEMASSASDDAVVDAAIAAEVREAIETIDTTLDAELQLTYAYVITPKRFDTARLLQMPNSLLGENVFSRMVSLAQFDFSEACKCLAFERPTAAAFHLMRCVEGVLRVYYCEYVKRDRIHPLLWFNMLDHAGKRRDAPPRVIVDHLNSIRTNFRNPTQHPDARFNMDEAQDLLAVSVDAINRMDRDLVSRKTRKPKER